MILRIIFCILISSSIISAQHLDSTKRPLLTLQSRVLPPWVVAGGMEVYALPRHSLQVIFGIGYYYYGYVDGLEYEKFKSFDYRFYFAFSRNNKSKTYFLSPSLKLSRRYFDNFDTPISDWLDQYADNKSISLLLGKRRYFKDGYFNFEYYLGPSYTFRTTYEEKYNEVEDSWLYNSYESTFWKLRAGFSIGCTFYTKKKKS